MSFRSNYLLNSLLIQTTITTLSVPPIISHYSSFLIDSNEGDKPAFPVSMFTVFFFFFFFFILYSDTDSSLSYYYSRSSFLITIVFPLAHASYLPPNSTFSYCRSLCLEYFDTEPFSLSEHLQRPDLTIKENAKELLRHLLTSQRRKRPEKKSQGKGVAGRSKCSIYSSMFSALILFP